ncbi:MAG: hypothetical protein CMJ29_06195 [Phycisphaerae bacterium]|nr:hypothetical protein [Phycisphaerae bacterium]
MQHKDRFKQESRSDHRDDDRCCESCGYPLRGLEPGSRCPECGQAEFVETPATPRLPWAPQTLPPSNCPKCDHSLKGLPPAGTCPECEAPYRPRQRRRHRSPLLPEEILESFSWRTGLVLLLVGLLLTFLSQFGSFAGEIKGLSRAFVMAMASLSWAFGLCLVLPSSIDGDQRHVTWLRLSCIHSQWLWPLVLVGGWYLERLADGVLSTLLWSGLLLIETITTLGLIGSLLFLSMATRDLYMRQCAARLQLVAVVLPIYVFVLWLMPLPISFLGGLFVSSGYEMHVVLHILVFGPWWIMLFMVLLSLLQVLNRANWSVRIRHNLDTRGERVAAKREAMGAAVGQSKAGPRVEPKTNKTPQWDESGDIPLSDSDDSQQD